MEAPVPPRARFSASPLPPTAPDTLPTPTCSSSRWLPVLEAPAPFSRQVFFEAASQMVLHPEYNSSTILRADILYDSTTPSASEADAASAGRGGDGGGQEGCEVPAGYSFVRRVRRRLLPRRTLDTAMEEECVFLQADDGAEGVLLLLPDLAQLDGKKLPYFYPQVGAVAFRWRPPPPPSNADQHAEDEVDPSGTVRINFLGLPLSPLPVPLPLDHRLYRTALALVKQLTQVGCGVVEGYQKRVNHDLLVGKEAVQDLYLVLKEKYRWMLKDWKESTDPSKHLWEDVAIASWLIILWSTMYPAGRPPGGFVDVGCGNGLLVFILSSEGYAGYGVDLRARKSWASYPETTSLRTETLDPITLLSSPTPPFPSHSFLIGNHADELTPWLPLLAASTPHAAYLSIPCCLHSLSGRFTFDSYTIPPQFLLSLPADPTAASSTTTTTAPGGGKKNQHELLNPFYAPAPTTTAGGRYVAYQLYLAHLSLLCGFVPEREALRIPSTKNFGIVGRTRVWSGGKGDEEGEEEVRERVTGMVEEARGKWVARIPEGKAGEH